MINNTSGIYTVIRVNGQKLETVTSFKYLGSVITDEGTKPEILSRTAQTTAASHVLNAMMWRSNTQRTKRSQPEIQANTMSDGLRTKHFLPPHHQWLE